MTANQFLRLIRQAEQQRQRESDKLITFSELERRIAFDARANQLVASAALCCCPEVKPVSIWN